MLITIFLSIVDPASGSLAYIVFLTTMIMLSYVIAYYSFYLFIFPKFYYNNKRKFLLWSITNFVLFQAFTYFNFYCIAPLNGKPNGLENDKIYTLGLNFTLYFVLIIITVFPAFQEKLNTQKLRLQFEKEKALILKNLGFYKNQFNEHITFNFLNYCYGYIHKDSKEGAETIELFSNILRHSLNNKSDAPILLSSEVQYISDFINLHKKLDNEIYVNYQTTGSIDGKYIFPRILITFIENVFKHGDIHDEDNPVIIKIDSNKDRIHFHVQNKIKKNGRKIPSMGIGFYNVKQQLELFYKNRYILKCFVKEENYFCELSINHSAHV